MYQKIYCENTISDIFIGFFINLNWVLDVQKIVH